MDVVDGCLLKLGVANNERRGGVDQVKYGHGGGGCTA